ncbi:MAG: IS66 family transposase [Opitutaceae bacterium]
MPPAEELYAENLQLKQRLLELQAQIEWLKRQMFGGGKSEKLDPAQLQLKLGELQKLTGEVEAIQKVSYERRTPREKVPTPADKFAHLPVKETVVIEPEEVEADPAAFEQIGEERTFEVDIVPPQLFKREIIRPKYRHRMDRSRPPVVAPAPKRAIEGGFASAGLIAHVAVSKYVDHLPLYRQQRMFERWSAPISRQSMSDWIEAVAMWLMPLYHLIRQQLLAGGYVQIDETPVRCRDPDLKRGKTFQGYFWVMGRPESDVYFVWAPSRQYGEVNRLLGEDFEGLMQSDGYAAYESYAGAHDQVVWVGCWAHARRGFFEAQSENPKATRVALRLIGRLYQLECQWDEQGIDAIERSRLREKHFARTLKWLHQLALALQQRCLPNQLLGKACGYLLNQWKPLTAHLRYGRTRLDNNLIEQAIRPSAIGKKTGCSSDIPMPGALRGDLLAGCLVSTPW